MVQFSIESDINRKISVRCGKHMVRGSHISRILSHNRISPDFLIFKHVPASFLFEEKVYWVPSILTNQLKMLLFFKHSKYCAFNSLVCPFLFE